MGGAAFQQLCGAAPSVVLATVLSTRDPVFGKAQFKTQKSLPWLRLDGLSDRIASAQQAQCTAPVASVPYGCGQMPVATGQVVTGQVVTGQVVGEAQMVPISSKVMPE